MEGSAVPKCSRANTSTNHREYESLIDTSARPSRVVPSHPPGTTAWLLRQPEQPPCGPAGSSLIGAGRPLTYRSIRGKIPSPSPDKETD